MVLARTKKYKSKAFEIKSTDSWKKHNGIKNNFEISMSAYS
jgi:hypothetical protein